MRQHRSNYRVRPAARRPHARDAYSHRCTGERRPTGSDVLCDKFLRLTYQEQPAEDQSYYATFGRGRDGRCTHFPIEPTGECIGLGLLLSHNMTDQGQGGTLRVKSLKIQGPELILGLPVESPATGVTTVVEMRGQYAYI